MHNLENVSPIQHRALVINLITLDSIGERLLLWVEDRHNLWARRYRLRTVRFDLDKLVNRLKDVLWFHSLSPYPKRFLENNGVIVA